MISLDLTRVAPLQNSPRPHLVKGRKVSICHHCKKSTPRTSLLKCNECRRDFCPSCLDACRCYTEAGFRIGARPRPSAPPHRLALITGTRRPAAPPR
jgi:predicted sulfurtransferase